MFTNNCSTMRPIHSPPELFLSPAFRTSTLLPSPHHHALQLLLPPAVLASPLLLLLPSPPVTLPALIASALACAAATCARACAANALYSSSHRQFAYMISGRRPMIVPRMNGPGVFFLKLHGTVTAQMTVACKHTRMQFMRQFVAPHHACLHICSGRFQDTW